MHRIREAQSALAAIGRAERDAPLIASVSSSFRPSSRSCGARARSVRRTNRGRDRHGHGGPGRTPFEGVWGRSCCACGKSRTSRPRTSGQRQLVLWPRCLIAGCYRSSADREGPLVGRHGASGRPRACERRSNDAMTGSLRSTERLRGAGSRTRATGACPMARPDWSEPAARSHERASLNLRRFGLLTVVWERRQAAAPEILYVIAVSSICATLSREDNSSGRASGTGPPVARTPRARSANSPWRT